MENAQVHITRVKQNLPPKGHVGILRVTDKQFGAMEIYFSQKKTDLPPPSQQLELF